MIRAELLARTARCLSGVHARWLTPPPSPDTPSLFYANHRSHLDALVLWSILPRPVRHRTRPVAAREYWSRNRLRRHLAADVFRCLYVDRGASGGAHPLAPLYAALDQGDSLILFPEGGRQQQGDIAPLKGGLYHLARHLPALPLYPVYLENLNRILPKGECLPVPLLGSITVGPPLSPHPEEDKAAFLERARQALVELQSP